MALLKKTNGSITSQTIYLAVPNTGDLDDILSKSEISESWFSIYYGLDHINFKKAFVESEGSMNEVTLTMSKKPYFSDQIYDLRGFDLEGMTTFQLSVVGAFNPSVENMIQNVLDLFPGSVNLVIKPEVETQMYNVMEGLFGEYENNHVFFNRYLRIKDQMTGIEEKPNKHLKRGSYVNYLCALIGRNDSSGYTFAQVNNVRGFHGDFEKDQPLDLSIVYVAGPGVSPRIFGTFLSIPHSDGCPAWEINSCDQSREFAGYLLDKNNLVAGASVLLPNLRLEVAPQNSLEFCTAGIVTGDLRNDVSVIESEIMALRNVMPATNEQLASTSNLVRVLYSNQ